MIQLASNDGSTLIHCGDLLQHLSKTAIRRSAMNGVSSANRLHVRSFADCRGMSRAELIESVALDLLE